MDILKTDTLNKGFPINLFDLRFVIDADRDGFLCLAKTLLGNVEHAILYGCEITDQTTEYSIAVGYVFFNSEIFYVPAHTLVKGAGTYYWTEDITYAPEGDKTLKDETAYSAHEVRRAKLAVSETPPVLLISSTLIFRVNIY